MDRIVNVSNLPTVARALQEFPIYMRANGPMVLYQVVNTKPMNQVRRRTPLATRRRWTYYHRADGKVSRTNREKIGSFGTLRSTIGSRVKGTSVEFGMRRGFDVPYAKYVHEMKNPAEGQYWQNGERGFGRGWTTKGTGAKFIEKPVRDTAGYVVKTLSDKIDSDLARRGL